MNKAAVIIASLAPLLSSGTVATADSGHERRCEQRGTILAYLSRQYSEAPVAMGVAENGGLIEVLTSRDGQTFTIIVTSPDGETCMVAAGEGWQAIAGRLAPPT